MSNNSWLGDRLSKDPENWTEDFSHENGMYSCQCVKCNKIFVGHKRRVVCKICFSQPAEIPHVN